MTNNITKGKVGSLIFVLSVLLVYPLPQFAIDLYTPSWLAMMHEFHVGSEKIQMTLTIYLLFLGLSQLVYGPLSDIYGRKPVLLSGVLVFLFSSILAVHAHTLWQLNLSRALQGLGLGCGFTVASAILADVYHGNRLAQMTSYSAMVYSSSVILAPLAGGYIQHYLGWRYHFIFMFVYSLILAGMILVYVKETNLHKADRRHIVKDSLQHYALCFRSVRFMGNVLGLTIAYALIVVISVVSPFLLMKHLHISELMYGKFLALIGLSYFWGATMNSRMIKKHSIAHNTRVGLVCMLVGSILLTVITLIDFEFSEAIIVSACVSVFGVGFVYPNCFATALDVFEEKGATGAFVGCMGLVGTGIISIIISHCNIPKLPLLTISFFVLSVLCAACCFLAGIKPKIVEPVVETP